jgi:heme/copper-type cytochrome/quinol oxidase subunit 2
MGRNLLVLAGTLGLFSVISFAMAFVARGHAALPGDASLWQMVGLVLMVAATFSGVIGMLMMMYAQVKRREEERTERDRRYGR